MTFVDTLEAFKGRSNCSKNGLVKVQLGCWLCVHRGWSFEHYQIGFVADKDNCDPYSLPQCKGWESVHQNDPWIIKDSVINPLIWSQMDNLR